MTEETASPPREMNRRLRRAQGLALSFATTTVCLLFLVIALRYGWLSKSAAGSFDEEVKQRAVAELVEVSTGIWDSFPDPDVARLHLPNLQDRSLGGQPIRTNSLGLREGEILIPKPSDLVRVVLLGDSFVFGAGVRAEERVGVELERLLRERGRLGREVEVLHVAVGSWNIRSETEYLRRNLSNFAPDLVIQILVSNDLNDTGDVRGFGSVADFSSQHRERTSSFFTAYPIWKLGHRMLSHLNHGLGEESRRRYADAAARLGKLNESLARRGVRHLVVLNWDDFPALAARRLTPLLDHEDVTFLPASFRNSPAVRISGSDPHWSAEGHRQMARFLYGAIHHRDLLSGVDLVRWKEAEQLFERLDGEGRSEAGLEVPLDLEMLQDECTPTVRFPDLTEQMARQVYGGVDRYGHVEAYAAILLAREEGRSIRIRGRYLHRIELDGTKVQIFLDEVLLDELQWRAGEAFDLVRPLPAEILDRRTFDIRFEADDYAYLGPALRSCVVFQLSEVSVVR